MGLHEVPKLCKVTVHRVSPQCHGNEHEHDHHGADGSPARRYTTTSSRHRSTSAAEQLARWTVLGAKHASPADSQPDARPVDEEPMDYYIPPRTRRAKTVTEGMGYERMVRSRSPASRSASGSSSGSGSGARTPMWRLTQRTTERMTEKLEDDAAAAAAEVDAPGVDPSVASLEAVNPLAESMLRVDTNERDPEPRAQAPEERESKLFEPATPPIPSGWTLDMLPTTHDSFGQDAVPDANGWFDVEKLADDPIPIAEPTKKAPSSTTDDVDNSAAGSYESDYPALQSECELASSHIRISTPRSDDAHDLSFSQVVPSFSDSEHMSEVELEPVVTLPASLHAETIEIEAMRANFIAVKHLDEPEQPLLVEATDDEDDDNSPIMDAGSDDEQDDDGNPADEDQNGLPDDDFDVCDDFDAILGDPVASRPSRWHLSMSFARRSFRTYSERIGHINSPPPAARLRNRSAPMPVVRQEPVAPVAPGDMLFHGQVLHLAFQASTGDLMQVSCHERRSHKNPLSKRILCRSAAELPMAHCDALRIIGHGEGGLIRGGDAISLARNDGSVLRMQTLSSKLCFSRKIDLKSKFVVCGVPEGMPVTTTTKFYLQSVYDRSKTVGFLSEKHHLGMGTLGVYAYGNREEKSEPVQFFRRPPERPLSPLAACI